MKERSGSVENNLNPHWLVTIFVALSVFVYIFVCLYYGPQMQMELEESHRVLIRTLLYVLAIVIFPFTSLLRHILLRLNQTMPGDTPAKKRYLVTVLMTQVMMEAVALFGLLMFVLGDGNNTLYIFSSMAVLGVFLHRPKMTEYEDIVVAVNRK